MSLKDEIKRTRKKLKERQSRSPDRVTVKPKHLKKVARDPEEAKEILKRGRLPLNKDWPGKLPEGEYQVQTVPPRADTEPLVSLTNGVDAPVGLLAVIKNVRDVKVAKKIARAATSWYRKLHALEEIRMVKEFEIDQDVWWTKKGLVSTGQVFKLKTRKIVVRTGVSRELIVLPVRKVKKGPVPKEYLQPDPRRWRIGRVKGGETGTAEAVVQ
jgi:hypothetical protein